MNRPDAFEEQMEPERYELYEEPRYSFELSRRAFVQVLGAGLLVTVARDAFTQGSERSARSSRSLGARLHLGEDGTITVLTGKVEVGQGSRTQLTQAAAEELRVSPEAIRLVMADTDLVPNDGGTFGSFTTPRTVPAVRKAAAAVRQLLVETAAKTWRVREDSIELRDGSAAHTASGRSMSYAELASSKTMVDSLRENVPADVEVTQVDAWKVLGTPALRPNAADIVTGTHRFPSDIVRPNMLYGKVLRPPSYGAELIDVDLDRAKSFEGVSAVRDGQFVGCTAPNTHLAQQAIEAIADSAMWKTQVHPPSSSLFTHLKELSIQTENGPRPPRARTRGSITDGLARATEVIRAAYHIPYIQHVPMEPRAATAEWVDGKLSVWTGTQRPNGVRAELASAFNIPRDRVRVVVPDTGGGFGGKHTGDAAVEAARLALAAKRPVSLRWTREEEFIWAYFRPAGLIETVGGLDEKGRVIAWDFTNINSGAAALNTPYAVANTSHKFVGCDSPLREGSYRSLAAVANTFARESFMDELAAKAGIDPLEFRLNNLDDERMRAVLIRAAENFGWSKKVKASGKSTGIGLACGTDKGSYVAACAEISVNERTGKIHVERISQAFECGAIQNPGNLRSQVEGGIIMGLGGALTEEIQFENGKILNASLKRYDVPRFDSVPKLEIELVNRPDLPSAGAGETPIIAVAPATGNAVYQATGERLRVMPLRLPSSGA